jgi:hypothetical protein
VPHILEHTRSYKISEKFIASLFSTDILEHQQVKAKAIPVTGCGGP